MSEAKRPINDELSARGKVTDDEKAFGPGAWVYCSQHLRAHQTGWCTVSVRDKLGLGITGAENGKEARDKCREFGLRLYCYEVLK